MYIYEYAYILLSLNAGQHLKSYLGVFRGDNMVASRPLNNIAIATHGNVSAISVRSVQRILKKYEDVARQTATGSPDSVSPHTHTMRCFRETALYRDGVPLEQVSALLGHSQIETTRSHYAFPSPEQLKSTVEKGEYSETFSAGRMGRPHGGYHQEARSVIIHYPHIFGSRSAYHQAFTKMCG